MTAVETGMPRSAVFSDSIQSGSGHSSNQKRTMDDDAAPIDLTLRRGCLTSNLHTAPSSSIYICPICDEEQATIDHFVGHMMTHRWKKSVTSSQERSWLLLARSSLLKSSRRLKILRRSRRRHRELKPTSPIPPSGSGKQPLDADQVETEVQEAYLCPACPTSQRIVGVQDAVNHFESFHMQIIVVCNICGMWFNNQTMFASHVAVAHLRRCPEVGVTESSPSVQQPPPPEQKATTTTKPPTSTSTTTTGFERPQQVIDPVVASILFSSLLLSTQSSIFPPSTSQKWKDMESKLSVTNAIRENASQVLEEKKSTIKDVLEIVNKATVEEVRGQLPGSFDRRTANSADPVLLYDHPLQRLLPPHVAVALDRSTVAKICHYCFKEFTDEMAVLKHQVLVHRLDESSNESSILT